MRLLLLVVCLFLTSCNSPQNSSAKKKSILCTVYVIKDLLVDMAGDQFSIEVLMPKNIDPHSYELVKGDRDKIFNSELVFSVGLNLEAGASLFSALENSRNVVKLGDRVNDEHKDKIIKYG